MANKFIKQVNLNTIQANPNLISPNINTQNISKVTSGNVSLDIAYKVAGQMATKLDSAKRSNELAKLKIEANNRIQEYESQWEGKDKFSDDNYQAYIDGLNQVYELNKSLIGDTKYTKEEDVNQWYNTVNGSAANKNFVLQGQKNEYDSKKVVDDTIFVATGLMYDYINNDNKTEAEKSREEALKGFDKLKGLIPESNIREMKMNTLLKGSGERLKRKAQEIIDSNDLSIEEKQEALTQLTKGSENKAVYEIEIDNLIAEGSLDKENRDTYLSNLENSTKDFIRNNSNKLKAQLENQKYTLDRKVEAEKEKLRSKYVTDYRRIDSNIRSGNYTIAISDVEETPLTPTDIMQNSYISKKYFGDTVQDIVNNGEFVQMYSTTETSRFKQEIQANENAGQDRSTSISSVTSLIESYDDDPIQKENMIRSLLSRGVVNVEDVELYKTSPETLNYISAGKQTKKAKNILYSELSDKGGIAKAISQYNLSISKQTMLNNYILGQIVTGNINWSSQLDYTAQNFNREYRRNLSFRQIVDGAIGDISGIKEYRIKERKAKPKAFEKALSEKYNNSTVYLNKKPVEVYRRGYTESVFGSDSEARVRANNDAYEALIGATVNNEF